MNADKVAAAAVVLASIVSFSLVVLSQPGGGGQPMADDRYQNLSNVEREYLNTTLSASVQRTDYPTEAAFLGGPVYIKTFPSSSFNITNSSGGEVDSLSPPGRKMLASGANASSSGRYYVWNESSGQRMSIDFFSSNSNVTGRIKSSSPVTGPEIELRYWYNSSLIADSSNDGTVTAVNISQPSSWESTTDEYVFRVNTSIDRYWIGVRSDNQGWKYQGSRGIAKDGFSSVPAVSSPRIHDFNSMAPGEANATGKLVWDNGSAAEGLKVEVKGYGNMCSRCSDRAPRFTTPPVRTDFTDSNGNFSVSGLNPGTGAKAQKYSISVLNHSVAYRDPSFFKRDFSMNDSTLTEKQVGSFTVTDDTGDINATIDASAGNATWVLAAFKGSTGPRGSSSVSYFAAQPDIENSTLYSIPNGSYSVVAAKFPSQGAPSQLISENLDVRTDETVETTFEIPTKVTISGYIKDTDGNGLENATMVARNSSELFQNSTMTDSDGSYSFKVDNDTGYDLVALPPEGKNLQQNDTELTVTGDTSGNNLTLGTGAKLNGTVTDSSGNPVQADIVVWQQSGGSYTYRSDTTNSSGEYSLEGLDTGKEYNLDVYPFSQGTEENHSSVTLDSTNDTVDVILGAATKDVYGYVTDGSGNGLDATVRLGQPGKGSGSIRSTNSSGGYLFANRSEDASYRAEVVPENSSYSTGSRSFYLDGDGSGSMKQNFSLVETSGLEGYVKNGSGDGIASADVFAYNFTTEEYGFTQTDSSGQFSLDLSPGSYNLEASKQGYPTNNTVAEVASGTDNAVNITLSTGQSLTGHITEDGSATTYNGSIDLSNSSEDYYAHADVESGEFSFSGLRDIPYDVHIQIENDTYSPSGRKIDSPSSLANTKNFSVSQNSGQKLNITVEDGSEDPVENVTVTIPTAQKETGPEGVVSFPQQPVEDVPVSASKDGYESVSKTVSISKPGNLGVPSTREVTLPISSTNEISVELNVTEGGEGLNDAQVVLRSNRSGVGETGTDVTGSEGRSTVSGLTEGDYLATVVSSQGEVASGNINLNASEGWKKRTPLGSSSFDIWWKASR